MPETRFTVSYEGPGVTDGRIPAHQIGSSLQALADVFSAAQPLVHADKGPVVLKVEATSEGSFEVSLVLEAANIAWDWTAPGQPRFSDPPPM